MKFHLTTVSANLKTGPIPVSISARATCPSSCPLKGAGCYAEFGPVNIHWKRVSTGQMGVEWTEFLEKVRNIFRGQLWRHNQAGDLPGAGNRINFTMLKQLVTASKRTRGFTFTHKPMTPANRVAVKYANDNGFTINLSADNLVEADKLAALNVGPVVVVVPQDMAERFTTPDGRKGIVCLEQTGKVPNCAACRLCAIPTRQSIIGFRAHGVNAKKLSERVRTP
jgi:hypothetical protein